jgi:hypothetical protein
MKKIVTVLMDSPLYFTMSLQERYVLVKRLAARERDIDLTIYRQRLQRILEQAGANFPPAILPYDLNRLT